MRLDALAPAGGEPGLAARLESRGTVTAAAGFTAAQLADLGAAAPARLAQPESAEALRDLVIEAGAAGAALLVIGGGTALGLGAPLERADLAVSTRGLARVVESSPADFVVTIEAGARLADLQRELAVHRQWLAIEPPDPERATIGGLIAAGATSLVASGHGTLRNHLLGVRVLHGDGRFAKAGGRVVKNVAGYDLMKLHHGALGTLGVVVAATLRLRPLPAADLVAWSECSDREAVVACADALAQPGFLPAGVHFVATSTGGRLAGEVVVRFQGARAAVLDQLARLSTTVGDRLPSWRREVLETAERASRPRPLGAIEQALARGDEPGAHLALHFRPSRLKEALEALARFGAGACVLELARGTGALRPERRGGSENLAALEALRRAFEAAGGAVTVNAGSPAVRTVLPSSLSSDGAMRLAAALRHELDPRDVLHRGRLGVRKR